MSSTSSSSAIFTGSSQFSSDLAQVIQRAVSFASLPLQQMQSDLTSLQSQQSAAQTLSTDFVNVQSAIQAVESAATGASAFSATVSNSSSTSSSSTAPVVSASLSGTPTAGSYSLNVTSPGAYASAMSNDVLPQVSDPDSGNISDASTYTLTIGTTNYTIQAAGNTLSDLEQALNASGDVDATLVNIGGSSPDYRLSLEGTQLGNLPIQLAAADGSNPGQTLMTAQSPAGAPAEYQVNGQPATPVQSNTSTVTISPGVTVNLLGAGTATVTVSPSTSALSSALANLTNAYNTAMADINKNRGQSGGALAGQSLLMELSGALESIAGYSTGNNGISSLTALGFSFDQNGVLSFDSSAFASAVGGQNAQLMSFLGSSTTGGFLQMASNALTGMEDPESGILTQDLSSLASQITDENNSISDEQDKITDLQTNLTQQMATADAAIATLEQQSTEMTDYYEAMQMQAQENA